MTERYPGYEVLAKRTTPSWDETTRRVIDRRLVTPRKPRWFDPGEWAVADALCRRILPHDGSENVPLVALLDAKLYHDEGGGFRQEGMPYLREAWRLGLAGLDADARATRNGHGFAALTAPAQDDMLRAMQQGHADAGNWQGMDPQAFFKRRILVDIPPLFYSQPAAWNELGFGGPASPRGYVRLDGDRLDPWEAVEAVPGDETRAVRLNRHVV